jgi:protocatechuate 3,4-dioxygenase beta subunit
MRLRSRRSFLASALAAPLGLASVAGVVRLSARQLPGLPFNGTRPCDPNAKPTPARPKGSDFRPHSPERSVLAESGLAGTKLVLTGQVIGIRCGLIAGAVVDFWQADSLGTFDRDGFRLRGHQLTDGEGRYRLETIVPGAENGRARRLHVNVQAPKAPIVTTQLFFSNDASAARDAAFDRMLVITITDRAGNQAGTFDFLLDL